MATASSPSSWGVKVSPAAIAATGTSAEVAPSALVTVTGAARPGVTTSSRTRWASSVSTRTGSTSTGSSIAVAGSPPDASASVIASAAPSRSSTRPSAGSTRLGVVFSRTIVASTGARSTWAAMVSIWAVSAVSSAVISGSTARSLKSVTIRVHGLSGCSAAASTVPSTSSAMPAVAGERVVSTSAATTVWSAITRGARSFSSVVAASASDSPPMSMPATTVLRGISPEETSRSTP